MIRKKVIIRGSIVILTLLVFAFIYIMFFKGISGDDGFPDFNKSVYLNSKFSKLAIEVKLNPNGSRY